MSGTISQGMERAGGPAHRRNVPAGAEILVASTPPRGGIRIHRAGVLGTLAAVAAMVVTAVAVLATLGLALVAIRSRRLPGRSGWYARNGARSARDRTTM